MPQPNLETELTESQVAYLDELVLGGKHTYQQLSEVCKSQGWPSRSTGTWTDYKRRAQQRAITKSITDGSALRRQIETLADETGDKQIRPLLGLLGNIARQLAANGTADPAQLKLAHKMTQLLLEAEGMHGRAELEEKRLEEKRKDRDLEFQKWQASMRTKVETALAALAEEIKGNAKAQAALQQVFAAMETK